MAVVMLQLTPHTIRHAGKGQHANPRHTPELIREVTLCCWLAGPPAAPSAATAAMSPDDTGSSAPYTSRGSCLVSANFSRSRLEGCTQYLVVLRVNCKVGRNKGGRCRHTKGLPCMQLEQSQRQPLKAPCSLLAVELHTRPGLAIASVEGSGFGLGAQGPSLTLSGAVHCLACPAPCMQLAAPAAAAASAAKRRRALMTDSIHSTRSVQLLCDSSLWTQLLYTSGGTPATGKAVQGNTQRAAPEASVTDDWQLLQASIMHCG